jgi:PleD family two-component response regulator
VMLEDSKADTGILSSRLQDSLDVFNKKPDLLCELGISIGVARYDPESPCSIDELMSKADALMYEQKRSKQEDKI